LPCVSGATRKNLRRRIEEIMSRRIGARLSFAKKAALMSVATAALAAPILVGMAAVPLTARAQQDRPPAGKPLVFEAASVKPTGPGGGPFGRTTGGPGTRDPGRIRYSNMTLKAVLLTAFGVDELQIEGPGWMETERFDIDATMPGNTTSEQFREMLRNLLVERFKIALHRETKEVPAHTLVVARNGLRIAESASSDSPDGAAPARGVPPQQFERDRDGFPKLPAGGPPGLLQFVVLHRARLQGRLQTMAELAARLAYLLGQPVVDGTRLTGKYDFTLTFATEGTAISKAVGPPLPPTGGNAPPAAVEGDVAAPDLFSAVQSQLGLRLESKKATMEVIAIDHAEKTPVAN